MKVERTLIALGLVLAVAGAMVAVNGYIYVNVDRGPPLMVSGTLLFGSGLVLAALGFVLRGLQSISADASKAALMLAKGRNGAFAAEPNASSPPKPLPPFEQPAAAPVAREPEPLPAKAAEAEPFAPPSATEKVRRPLLPPALAPRVEPPAKPVGASPPPFSWMVRPNSAETPVAKDDDDWLNQAIAAEAGKVDRQKKGKEKEKDGREEPAMSPAREAAREAEQALIREFGLRDAEAQGTPVQGTPVHETSESNPPSKPEVIGNYEAHGAHYTMFADGSIEAETQHGVYRFASIEELKRFIEGEESGEGA